MPSIKDYKERLRLLENHIGSLRKQNDELRHENESLKDQLAESKENHSSTIDKLNEMEELLTQKSNEIAKIQEKAKKQAKIDNESKTFVKDEPVPGPVENVEIELGVENDCVDLETFINELEIKRYELVKIGTSRYKCPIEPSCTFQADISKMHEHTRKHTGERPFQCAICNKYFVSKSVTRRHVRGKHMEHINMNFTESETQVQNDLDSCSDKENSSPANKKSPQTRYSLRRSNAKRKILDETSAEINIEKRFKTDI